MPEQQKQQVFFTHPQDCPCSVQVDDDIIKAYFNSEVLTDPVRLRKVVAEILKFERDTNKGSLKYKIIVEDEEEKEKYEIQPKDGQSPTILGVLVFTSDFLR
jgi:hypothetical protein